MISDYIDKIADPLMDWMENNIKLILLIVLATIVVVFISLMGTK